MVNRQRWVVEHRLARLVQLGIRQARYFGRVKTRFQLYLATTMVNLTLVASKAGLTEKPAPVPATAAPWALEWSTPPPHGSGKFGPSPARIGLTDQIPLPNKGFPSWFLGRVAQRVAVLAGLLHIHHDVVGGVRQPVDDGLVTVTAFSLRA